MLGECIKRGPSLWASTIRPHSKDFVNSKYLFIVCWYWLLFCHIHFYISCDFLATGYALIYYILNNYNLLNMCLALMIICLKSKRKCLCLVWVYCYILIWNRILDMNYYELPDIAQVGFFAIDTLNWSPKRPRSQSGRTYQGREQNTLLLPMASRCRGSRRYVKPKHIWDIISIF